MQSKIINKTIFNNLSDKELVDICNNTEDSNLKKESFGLVIERNYQPLKSFIRRLGGDQFEVEDCVHDTFIKAFENTKSFAGHSSVSTWLHAIAKNSVIDGYRAASRRPPLVDVDIENVFEEGSEEIQQQVLDAFTDYATPEEIYSSVELMERIEEQVATLSEELQELFQLRYIQQYEYSEIADELDIPLGTVSNRIFTLNKVIQEIINE